MILAQLDALVDGLAVQRVPQVTGQTARGLDVVLHLPGRGGASFEVGADVEDQSFEVVRALLELPKFLVAAGLVVQHTDNHIAINIFATAGRVLQNLLGLGQVDQGLFGRV